MHQISESCLPCYIASLYVILNYFHQTNKCQSTLLSGRNKGIFFDYKLRNTMSNLFISSFPFNVSKAFI